MSNFFMYSAYKLKKILSVQHYKNICICLLSLSIHQTQSKQIVLFDRSDSDFFCIFI